MSLCSLSFEHFEFLRAQVGLAGASTGDKTHIPSARYPEDFRRMAARYPQDGYMISVKLLPEPWQIADGLLARL